MDTIKPKTLCKICKKNIGQFRCEICVEYFCSQHVAEHQEKLNQELDEILRQYDTHKKTIDEYKIEYESVFKSIEQWEQISIATIQRVAKETRAKLEIDYNQGNKISKELNQLNKQIQDIQQTHGSFEMDLPNWRTSIEKAKNYLNNTVVPNHIIDDKTKPLIYQIQIVPKFKNTSIIEYSDYYQLDSDSSFEGERFFSCYGNARIVDNGQVVINGNASFFGTEIRGKIDYSNGQHDVRFQIENSPSKVWIFIGIITKTARLGGNLFASSSVYGWGDYHDYFLAGHRQRPNADVLYNYTREGDIIKLSIDCSKRSIQYMNERNRKTEKLSIDLDKCPFPWQLYLSLGGKDDRIRLLNSLTRF